MSRLGHFHSVVENNSRKVLYEPLSKQLQNQVEGFTKRKHQDLRRNLLYEDQRKEKLKLIHEKKHNISQILTDNSKHCKNVLDLKSLEKKVDIEIQKYNVMLTENIKLKEQINAMRKNLNGLTAGYNELLESISKTEKETKKHVENRFQKNSEAQEANIQIHALKTKHENDREYFLNKIEELQKQNKAKPINQKITERKDNKSSLGAHKKGKEEEAINYSNPLDLLNIRLNRWKTINKEKKIILDQYIRRGKILEEAFQKIIEVSGCYDLNEIGNTFIKSENQNKNIVKYIEELSQEYEKYIEITEKLKDEIRKKDLNDTLKYEDKVDHENELISGNTNLRNLIEQKSAKLNEYKKIYSDIKGPVLEIMSLFKDLNVSLTVKTKLKFFEITPFDEKSILEYLSTFKEYMDNMLTLANHLRNNQTPIHSVLPLEKLNQKSFNERKRRFEPPIIHNKLDEEILPPNLMRDKMTLFKRISSQYQKRLSLFI